MKFAAIDIGSNAVRLLIADVFENEGSTSIKKLSLTRVPIRLGASVFDTRTITPGKTKKLLLSMKAFRHLIDVYEVKGFRACATSAMREAENAASVMAKVKKSTGIDIEVITGQTEADLIYSTFESQKLDGSRDYLYIDVGGGSTEITLLHRGRRVTSRSFDVGTVRILKNKVTENTWEEMRRWVSATLAGQADVTAICTGGNINRYFKMSGLGHGELMSRTTLQLLHDEMARHTVRQRIKKFRLRPDRADVIVPAGDIYLTILESGGIDRVSVPKIGLSDGIALYLYHRHRAAKR